MSTPGGAEHGCMEHVRKRIKGGKNESTGYTFAIPVLGRHRQEDYHKSEVSLAYTVRSRPARAVSNKNKNKARKKRAAKIKPWQGLEADTQVCPESLEWYFFLCGKHDRSSTALVPLGVRGLCPTALVIFPSIWPWSWLCPRCRC